MTYKIGQKHWSWDPENIEIPENLHLNFKWDILCKHCRVTLEKWHLKISKKHQGVKPFSVLYGTYGSYRHDLEVMTSERSNCFLTTIAPQEVSEDNSISYSRTGELISLKEQRWRLFCSGQKLLFFGLDWSIWIGSVKQTNWTMV